MSGFASAPYWEARYQAGGNSGVGSFGRLAKFKANFINRYVKLNNVGNVVELGCGDGSQLSLLDVPQYMGVDVSQKAISNCRERFNSKSEYAFVLYKDLAQAKTADLSLSMDVIFHLVEDDLYEKYMNHLLMLSRRYAIVYSSNIDRCWPYQHVRHRCFTRLIAERYPEWQLAAHVPNIYPYDSGRPHDTSFSDFYVFKQRGEQCVLEIPPSD
jgi:SAM-dependent methyltransferase